VAQLLQLTEPARTSQFDQIRPLTDGRFREANLERRLSAPGRELPVWYPLADFRLSTAPDPVAAARTIHIPGSQKRASRHLERPLWAGASCRTLTLDRGAVSCASYRRRSCAIARPM